MSGDKNTIKLVLQQGDDDQKSAHIDPLVERQRHCFENMAAAENEITLSFEQTAGFWRDGFIHLYRITVVKQSEKTGEKLLQYDTPDEILEGCQFSDLRYRHSALGEVFVITGPNPSLKFFLPKVEGEALLKFCIEISAPYSLDYAIAQDGFISKENSYISRIRELEYELGKNKEYKQEIADIKRSKAWLVIQAYRKFTGQLSSLLSVPRKIFGLSGSKDMYAVTKSSASENEYQYRFTEEDQLRLETGLLLLKKKPLISIVMPVYNVDTQWLQRAIESVSLQVYQNWELCIVDDASSREETIAYLKKIRHPRIKIRFLEKNRNISGATNEAIRFASGEYIAFMDNDDELTRDALYEMVKAINEQNADLIYSDEDFIDMDGEYIIPHYKPDFSPDLLLSHNYITHFVVVSKKLLADAGMLNSQYDGAQDHELLLRLTEKAEQIYHVQKVLYHWRRIETSTSYSSDAKPGGLINARSALKDTLVRRGIDADVLDEKAPFFFRVKRKIKDTPLISIVIPFRDKPDLLDICVNSILDHSTWENFEIIAISNNSRSSETYNLIHKLEEKSSRFRCIEFNEEFNFSRVVNFGVSQSNGEYLIILNNDIEVISWDWIEAMLEQAQREEVGAVGAKLLYPNNTIQHAGIIIGLGGYAGHAHKLLPINYPGYFNLLHTIHNVSAVTGACFMISRSKYDSIGGFDEENFKIAYNDVDFCLRLREKGLLNVFTPYAELYHHESISRGYEDTEEKQQRFSGEKARLRERHADIFEHGDPYYNPNLTHDDENYSLAVVKYI